MTYQSDLEQPGLENLNRALIPSADGAHEPIRQGRERTSFGDIEVLFDDLEQRLVAEIEACDAVVGCVAWLTNEAALRALAKKQAVSILVNKEDFLRPDSGLWSRAKIRTLYGALSGINRWNFWPSYNYCGSPHSDAVRCVGVRAERKAVPARMHHKFLVFCRMHTNETGDTTAEPVGVWTGSFNVSENGCRSLENVVIVRRADVARAFYDEWGNLLGISEPLNWHSTYVTPEYRIGS